MKPGPTPAHRNPIPILAGAVNLTTNWPASFGLDRPVVGTAWALNGFSLELDFQTSLLSDFYARIQLLLGGVDLIDEFEFAPDPASLSNVGTVLSDSHSYASPNPIFDTHSLGLRVTRISATATYPGTVIAVARYRGSVAYLD